MYCGQMEFNKLAVPASSITINSSQSNQKNERERDRRRSNKRAHKYVYRLDRSQRGRQKEKTDNLTWRYMKKVEERLKCKHK
jgi:hypothetical protein